VGQCASCCRYTTFGNVHSCASAHIHIVHAGAVWPLGTADTPISIVLYIDSDERGIAATGVLHFVNHWFSLILPAHTDPCLAKLQFTNPHPGHSDSRLVVCVTFAAGQQLLEMPLWLAFTEGPNDPTAGHGLPDAPWAVHMAVRVLQEVQVGSASAVEPWMQVFDKSKTVCSIKYKSARFRLTIAIETNASGIQRYIWALYIIWLPLKQPLASCVCRRCPRQCHRSARQMLRRQSTRRSSRRWQMCSSWS
jgi:hypothetical protein